MHWNPKQVTIHSGILKFNGTKSYHPYFSDDLKHDSTFVETAIEKILGDAEIGLNFIVIIQSDNCSSHYKSVHHLAIQNLCNKKNIRVVRIWSVAGHDKGEVDHVGGIAKIFIRREVAAGQVFTDAEEMCHHMSI